MTFYKINWYFNWPPTVLVCSSAVASGIVFSGLRVNEFTGNRRVVCVLGAFGVLEVGVSALAVVQSVGQLRDRLFYDLGDFVPLISKSPLILSGPLKSGPLIGKLTVNFT